jgi:hypothetical protein
LSLQGQMADHNSRIYHANSDPYIRVGKGLGPTNKSMHNFLKFYST